MGISHRLAALALVVLPTLVGCAGSTDAEDASSDSAAVTASAPVTLKNFVNHPKIVEIRSIVATVDANLATFKKESKDNLCDGAGEANRDLYTQNGAARRLVLGYGGDDSASTTTLTYDVSGHVRFAYTEYNDVHGNSSDTRVYFAADGSRIIEVTRSGHAEEPGSFDLSKAPYQLSDDPEQFGTELTSPAAKFASAPECP